MLQQQSDVIQLSPNSSVTNQGPAPANGNNPTLLRGAAFGRALLADETAAASVSDGQALRLPSAYSVWDLQLSIIILFAGVCVVTACHVVAWRLLKLMGAEARWPR